MFPIKKMNTCKKCGRANPLNKRKGTCFYCIQGVVVGPRKEIPEKGGQK
jgi:hypothetical protein